MSREPIEKLDPPVRRQGKYVAARRGITHSQTKRSKRMPSPDISIPWALVPKSAIWGRFRWKSRVCRLGSLFLKPDGIAHDAKNIDNGAKLD